MSQELAKDALLIGATGKPFSTEKWATISMEKKGLDPSKHTVVEHPLGGYAIKRISKEGEVPMGYKDEEGVKVDIKPAVTNAEKYFKVRFHAKSNPNDTDNVTLGVNGEILVIKREEEIIIPERFVECARHATYPQFTQLPNEPRKMTGKVMTFPLDILGEGTQEDFLKMKKEGNAKTLEALDRASL